MPGAPDDAVLGDGDVALVTGSTSGIGHETARNLAATGASVLVHGRDRQRARETAAALPGDGHDWYVADFADLAAVRDLAASVRADYDRLDCLVNNAGTWQSDRHLVECSDHEELELTFVVNHLAPFLLTHDLRPLLVETGRRRASGPGGQNPARVVTVSSGVHRRATMDLDAVRGREGPTGVDAYALSKLANVMFAFELARRLPDHVTATCCHPGASPATRLARDGSVLSRLGWRLFGLVGGVVGITESPREAAETPTYLACSPAVTGVSGEYFEDCERARPAEAALDRAGQADLWQTSADWVGLEETGG